MLTIMGDSIRDRLLRIERELLLAVAEGSDSLESFEQKWTALSLEVESATASPVFRQNKRHREGDHCVLDL